MQSEKYELSASASRSTYKFTSDGRKGKIDKIVQYVPMLDFAETVNCGFGDLNPQTGAIDDNAITNNEDGPKVIATVIGTIYDFTRVYPNTTIHFRGSDQRRTKIYGKIIHDHYEELAIDFEIYGITDTLNKGKRDVETFDKSKKTEYDAYLIKRRRFGTF